MEQDINAKFDEKIKELEEKLPKMGAGWKITVVGNVRN